MNIARYLGTRQGVSVSYEILPPKRGRSIDELYHFLDPLMEFKPAFIGMANHQSQDQYFTDPTGRHIKSKPDKRPGSFLAACALKNHYRVEVLPHLTCNELLPYEIEDLLIVLSYLDIQNIMALRGDNRNRTMTRQEAMAKYNQAQQLVQQVSSLNEGRYLEESLKGIRTNFCVGVAGYPDKHPEAQQMESDMHDLTEKVAAGAHFIITQMFFNNSSYKSFVERCSAANIQVPILPGLKPIYSKANLDIYQNKFKIAVPQVLAANLQAASNKKDELRIGKVWLRLQCKDLLASGSSHLHFFVFTPDAAVIVTQVLKEIL